MEEIRKIHKELGKETYGAGRIQPELVTRIGIIACPARIRSIMKQNDIKAVVRRKKFRYPKDTKSDLPVADNILNRDFTAEAENRKWVSDITYIRTNQGWLYLYRLRPLFKKGRRLVNGQQHENRSHTFSSEYGCEPQRCIKGSDLSL